MISAPANVVDLRTHSEGRRRAKSGPKVESVPGNRQRESVGYP